MNVFAVIPTLNEGAEIASVVTGAQKHVDTVIVIDDGSRDDTVKFAEEAGAIVIRHPHNLGKGAACRSGFHGAMKLGCDAIITLDGDGQHDPEDIPLLIQAYHHNTGIVIGNRMQDTKDMPWLRRMTNRTLSLLISCLAGQPIRDSQCGFRLIHRQVLEAVDYENNRYDAESEILVRASRKGFRITEVPVKTIYGSEFSKIHVFWDTLRFFQFFFRHLFRSPPVHESEARAISIRLGQGLKID